MFSGTPMVDMRRTPEEKSDACMPTMAYGSDYSYGLCISLDDESLKKLEVDFDSIEVGETYHFMAMAKVTAKSRNERSEGEPRECVEMQITMLSAESEDAEGAAEEIPTRKKMYSNK